jgi:hypothetical protein
MERRFSVLIVLSVNKHSLISHYVNDLGIHCYISVFLIDVSVVCYSH